MTMSRTYTVERHDGATDEVTADEAAVKDGALEFYEERDPSRRATMTAAYLPGAWRAVTSVPKAS